MGITHLRSYKHCRWCGEVYTASQPKSKDGFCTIAHKQAHHRAYQKYVTATDGLAPRDRRRRGRKQ